MKVAKNDECPCGSGKKYKECCLERDKMKKRIPYSTYPEEEVIKELLANSPVFKEFYDIEREKISSPVFWAQDDSLPTGVKGSCLRLATGEQVIVLRKIPAEINDADNIAHELYHLVLDNKGYPAVKALNSRYKNTAPVMNSMVQDVLVDYRLYEYGFDMEQKYLNEFQEDLRQLKNIPRAPTNRADKLLWMFNYVSKILDRKWLAKEGIIEEKEFKEWFGQRYPDIVEESKELISLIETIGYDTPERMKKLFESIINEYNLKKDIAIK